MAFKQARWRASAGRWTKHTLNKDANGDMPALLWVDTNDKRFKLYQQSPPIYRCGQTWQ